MARRVEEVEDAHFPAEPDLALPEEAAVVLEAIETTEDLGVTGQCSKPLAVTAEKNAKCLSGPQTANPSTAVIVLKKWVQKEKTGGIEAISTLRLPNPTKLSLI